MDIAKMFNSHQLKLIERCYNNRKDVICFLFQNFEIATKDLPQRNKEILKLRFGLNDGLPFTLEKIANALGLRKERVRQIILWSLRKVERKLKIEFFRFLTQRAKGEP